MISVKKLLAILMSLGIAVVLGMGSTGCTKKEEKKKETVEKTTTTDPAKGTETKEMKKTETETKTKDDKK
jgi:hypothetical protein